MVYFVSNEDVERLISVEEGMQAIENAYREWDAGRAAIRPKTNLYVFNSEDHTRYNYTSMEGAIQTLGIFAIRMRSDLSPHPRRSPTDLREAGGEGQHCGLIMFFSSRTGEPLAIANDGLLQHVRVGATAAIAAKYMARPDASVLGLLGSQWMAKSHAEALCKVRPIRRIKVYSPNREHRLQFAEEMTSKLGVEIEVKDGPEEAVRGADLVACCTNSTQQAVLRGEWLEPGTHMSCVLSREVGDDSMARIDYVVKHQEHRSVQDTLSVAAAPTSGEPATSEGADWPRTFQPHSPRLVDLIAGRAPGRLQEDHVTLFSNNEGNGIQFAATGAVILRRLREAGDPDVKQIPLDWFLQSIPD